MTKHQKMTQTKSTRLTRMTRNHFVIQLTYSDRERQTSPRQYRIDQWKPAADLLLSVFCSRSPAPLNAYTGEKPIVLSKSAVPPDMEITIWTDVYHLRSTTIRHNSSLSDTRWRQEHTHDRMDGIKYCYLSVSNHAITVPVVTLIPAELAKKLEPSLSFNCPIRYGTKALSFILYKRLYDRVATTTVYSLGLRSVCNLITVTTRFGAVGLVSMAFGLLGNGIWFAWMFESWWRLVLLRRVVFVEGGAPVVCGWVWFHRRLVLTGVQGALVCRNCVATV
jgi:hypothetical protein